MKSPHASTNESLTADGRQSSVRHADGSRRRHKPATPIGPAHSMCILVAYALMFGLILWRIYWTPVPFTMNASARHFSEERALQHAQKLAGEIGERQVSTPALDTATRYIKDTADQLVEQASQRQDLQVQVRQEQVTGGVLMALLGLELANVYQNLTNVILTITPKDCQDVPAVLVNAHFDSAVGSPGASDCATPVGVMLETARVFIADPDIKLTAPVIFLLNGAEETLSQAAHGFMTSHKSAGKLGAFINLESTGPGGPDILFQASGGWTSEVYAKAAPHARGQVFGQDLMDAQIIPADTDYRMFSYDYYGTLPGVDIAFLLDSSAYHTHQDAPHRIRPGTTQAMGDNVVAAIPAFAEHLSLEAAQNLPPASSTSSNSVYFDLCGLWMISYRATTARWLHGSVLPLVLLFQPPGVRRAAMAKVAGICLLSMLSCLALPAAVGGLRAFLSGQQLIWFSNHLAGASMYIPAAIVGAVLPFRLAQKRSMSISTQVAGSCLFNAILAAILVIAGGKVAYSHAFWGAAAYISLWIVHKVDSISGLAAALGCAVLPATSTLTGILLLATHLMEKMSMTGAPPGPLIWGPDAIMGALFGAGTFVFGGFIMPWLAHCVRQKFSVFVKAMMLFSAASAILASLSLDTYSTQTPKRLFIQHMIRDSNTDMPYAVFAAASSDATPIGVAFSGMNLTEAEMNGREWLAMYPMHDMIRGRVFEAPLPDPHLFATPPTMNLISRTPQGRGVLGRSAGEPCTAGETERLDLELRLPQPGVGVLNVTGSLQGWSFSKPLPKSSSKRGPAQHVARYGGNVGSESWPFWIDLQCGQSVSISIAASFLTKTTALQDFLDQMPDWVASSPLTTFQSTWEF